MVQTLYYSLGYYSETQLRQFAQLVCLPGFDTLDPSSLRRTLVEHFLKPEVMQRSFNELQEVDRAYLSEILHSKNYLALEAFEVRHGARPSIYRYGNRYVCTMRLFADRNEVHADVREVALQFIAPPSMVPIKIRSGDFRADVIVRETECDALNDVLMLLNAAHSGKIPLTEKTNSLGSGAVKEIGQILRGGDFYRLDQGDAIKAFAWTTLLQISGMCMVRDGTLTLNTDGTKQLLAPACEAIKTIWNKWTFQNEFEEWKRIAALKLEVSASRKFGTWHDGKARRLKVEAALQECPVGEWIAVEEFFEFIKKSGFHFELCAGEHALLLYGFPVPQQDRLCNLWNEIYGRYVRCFLMEYAATLGLVDVAFRLPDEGQGSRYDSLVAFRLSPLGAWILGKADSYKAPHTVSASRLTVLSSLRVTFDVEPQAEQAIFLDLFGERESSTTWQLSKERALDAAQRGYGINLLRDFLTRYDDQPLPEKVETFLELTDRNSQALHSEEPAVLIECVSKEIAAKIAEHRLTAKYAMLAGERHLVVRKGNNAQFRKAVNALGYGFALKDG